MSLLEVHDIHTFYGKIHALKGISLTVEEGEIVTLIGGNGAGKTTTLNTICGITPARCRAASILDGEDITHLRPHEIVKRGVVQVAGRAQNLHPPDRARKSRNGRVRRRTTRRPSRGTWNTFYERFPRLKERQKQLGGTLSGGEQQMLAIGRALMARPRILLLDEPSMGLAPLLVRDIFEVIRYLNQEAGTTILLVEQNALMALAVANRGYVLQSGYITHADTAEALRHDETMIEAYLGG